MYGLINKWREKNTSLPSFRITFLKHSITDSDRETLYFGQTWPELYTLSMCAMPSQWNHSSHLDVKQTNISGCNNHGAVW